MYIDVTFSLSLTLSLFAGKEWRPDIENGQIFLMYPSEESQVIFITWSSADGLPRWLSGEGIRLPKQETVETGAQSLSREDPLE